MSFDWGQKAKGQADDYRNRDTFYPPYAKELRGGLHSERAKEGLTRHHERAYRISVEASKKRLKMLLLFLVIPFCFIEVVFAMRGDIMNLLGSIFHS